MAIENNLSGYVKNISDGTVLIEAEGRDDILKDLVKWCERGSPSACVESVCYNYSEIKKDYSKFEIR